MCRKGEVSGHPNSNGSLKNVITLNVCDMEGSVIPLILRGSRSQNPKGVQVSGDKSFGEDQFERVGRMLSDRHSLPLRHWLFNGGGLALVGEILVVLAGLREKRSVDTSLRENARISNTKSS